MYFTQYGQYVHILILCTYYYGSSFPEMVENTVFFEVDPITCRRDRFAFDVAHLKKNHSKRLTLSLW